jgi:hypothetical protein
MRGSCEHLFNNVDVLSMSLCKAIKTHVHIAPLQFGSVYKNFNTYFTWGVIPMLALSGQLDPQV